MTATIIPFEPRGKLALQALRHALPSNPTRRSGDQEADLFELVGSFIELTPQVDA
jgi:hypothetical protein